MANSKNNLTEGSVLKSLMTLSIPIISANILNTAYQLTDTFWVGRLGVDAVAAVSISFPLLFLLIALGSGLSISGTILVAQYKGKNDQGSTDHIAGQTIIMVLLVSLVLSVVGYIFAPAIIKSMGTNEAVFVDAVAYLKVSLIGIVFLFFFSVFQALMRGAGEVKTPMYIILGTVILNFILDPLFIFGYGFIPATGVAGAAWASIGTQALSAIIAMFMLFGKKYHIKLHLKDLKPDFDVIKKLFKLGFPASIEQTTRALGLTIMIFLVSSFGTVAIAAYGIGLRILSFIIIPALGLSMATATLVGQNIGAGKIERAERITKISALLGFVTLTLVGIIIFIFARQISAVFIPGEIETIQSSTLFIKIVALTFGLICVQQVLSGAFIGSGNTFISMILSIVSLWVLRFPLAYFLSHHTKLAEVGIWIAFPITNIVGVIIAMLWFAKGTWKEKNITDEFKMSEKISEETIIEEGL